MADKDFNLKDDGKGVGRNRGNRAPMIWIIILLILSTMFLYRFMSDGMSNSEWSQTEFEKNIDAVTQVEAVPDGDNTFLISGKYKLSEEQQQLLRSQYPDRTISSEGEFKSRVIMTPELNKIMSEKQINLTVEGRDGYKSILISLLPVVLIILVLYFLFSRQMKMAGRGAMQFGKSKARMIPPDELHVTFDDIAGADEAKEEIQEVVEFLKDPLKFKLLGGKIPRGCLLTGAPGTGKTLLAKAVACEAKVPFFAISGSDFVEMFVGVGASRVRDMFEQARRNSPCLIFIDEIDAVGRSRFSGMGGGHDEREQTLNAMLVEMDGLESRSDVIVLAATNRPDVLDPALLRPGRFDRQVVMDLPDITGRRKILDVHIKTVKAASTIDLDVIARTTPGFSGADLASLCNEAALLAARENREAVVQIDLEEARDKVCWGRERRSRKISDRERRLTAYHEAGHTLVALYSPFATPVHKVTIIPRGQAYLGATFTMPKEDVYTRSRLEFLDELKVLMGGRVAEELVIGDITSGASADIEHASRIARQMVCVFGMDDAMGPIHYADYGHPIHVRLDAPPQDSLSPETAREIDMQVRKLVFDALSTARNLLNTHRKELEVLAQELLVKETLSIDELTELLHLNSEGKAGQTRVADVNEAVAQDILPDEPLVGEETKSGEADGNLG